MIAAIKARSADARGRVAYLFGQDKQGLHQDARTVAGPCHGVDPEHLAAELAAYQTAWSKQGDQTVHMVLSAAPGDGRLGDRQWQQIADEYMADMGYDGARWVAVNHGLNAAGADHIHILANRTQSNGTLVRDSNERRKAQQAAARIEHRHGLQITEGRHSGVSPVPLTGGEMAKAKQAGTEPERLTLARTARAIATTATDEANYFRLLRQDPAVADVRLRVQSGKVTGYSVVGRSGIPYQGGRLGRDLSIVRLRDGWTGGTGAPKMADAMEALKATATRLESAGPAEHAAISRDLSGALAVAARTTTGDASREWARRSTVAGQRGQAVRRPPPSGVSGLRGAAALLSGLANSTDNRDLQTAVRVLSSLEQLWRLYRAAEATRARRLRESVTVTPRPGATTSAAISAPRVVAAPVLRNSTPLPRAERILTRQRARRQ